MGELTDIKYQFFAFILNTALFIILVRYSTSSVGYVLMANAIYGNVFIFFLCALFGSGMVMALSRLTAGKYTSWLQPVGQKTMGIFLVHKPIVELWRSIVTMLGFSYDNPFFTVVITAATLAVSYIIVTIIKMIIPEMVGLRRMAERGRT